MIPLVVGKRVLHTYQVMPQLLNFIEIDASAAERGDKPKQEKKGGEAHKQQQGRREDSKTLQLEMDLELELDWGTLAVYVCANACDLLGR